MNDSASSQLFVYEWDKYKGVTIDKFADCSLENFEIMLTKTIDHLKTKNCKGVWIKVRKEKAHIIPILVKHGFNFHHAKNDYVMLTAWLSPLPNHLPSFATHYIGVGCILLHPEEEKILIIKEASGVAKGFPKIPGGLVDEGEEISKAAEREVFEETGIKSKYLGILGIWEKAKVQFGMGDLYCIVVLEPLNFEINISGGEVEGCEWMPIDEFERFAKRILPFVASSINGIKNILPYRKNVNVAQDEKEKQFNELIWKNEPFNLKIRSIIPTIFHSLPRLSHINLRSKL